MYKSVVNQSKLRIILSKSLDDYNNRGINETNSYELILNSESGILFKKLDNVKEIEFYDTEIRALFQDTMKVEIIFLDNIIYVNTNDDYNESSIKLRLKLPPNENIKFISFDLFSSYNIVLKNIRLINSVEQKYLMNIFEFKKKLHLNEKSYFIQEMNGGENCPGIGNRKTSVKYECDTNGVHDVFVSLYNFYN